jgi:NADH dehydrogenase
MRIAVTGALGLVGGAVAASAAALGHEVVGISRRTGVDVADAAAVAAAVAGCDAIVHCAGINREIGRQTYERVHVEAARNVVAAARAAGVRRIVLVSFLRARPDCGSRYHETKWAAEEVFRASGLGWTVVKLGVTYGRGDHLVSHLAWTARHLPVFASVGSDRSARPLDVADAARVLVAAADDERLRNRTIALTGPEEMPFSEIVRRVGAVVGRTPWIVRAPVIVHRVLARVLELTTRVPLVAVAQVRILEEGLVEPWGAVDPLPDEFVPTLRLTPERIRALLPADRSACDEFGCRLLRASAH